MAQQVRLEMVTGTCNYPCTHNSAVTQLPRHQGNRLTQDCTARYYGDFIRVHPVLLANHSIPAIYIYINSCPTGPCKEAVFPWKDCPVY